MELNKIFICKQQRIRGTSLEVLLIDGKLDFMILEIANAEIKIVNEQFITRFLNMHFYLLIIIEKFRM